jgi:hypothetical protein
VDDLLVINPSKIDAAIGAMRAEQGCGDEEAIIRLADAGFTFATAKAGYDEVYRRLYSNARVHNVLPETESPEIVLS